MKKAVLIGLTMMLASCGGSDLKMAGNGGYLADKWGDAEDYFADRNITSGDVAQGYVDARSDVGKAGNDSRKYFADRNVTSGDVAQGYVDAKDDTGAQANAARKHLSDRHISSEDVGQGYTDARDDVDTQWVDAKNHVGKKANESRDYLYDRGIDQMRHGDNDAQNKIGDTERRLDDAEARLAAIEQVNRDQGSLLDLLFSLTSAESAARKAADQSLSEALAAETAARQAADAAETAAREGGLAAEKAARESSDASEAAARAQADSDMAASFSQQLADTSAYFQGLVDTLQSELNDLSATVSSQGSDIATIQSHLQVVDWRIASLKHRVRVLERTSRAQARDIWRLKHKLNNLRDDLDDEIQDRQHGDVVLGASILASALNSWWQLQQVKNNLQGQITSVANRASVLESDVDALDG